MMILVSAMILLSNVNAQDLREAVFESGLRPPSNLVHVDESFVHLGMILTNVAGTTKHQDNIKIEFLKNSDGMTKMLVKFKKMLASIFLHSSATPIHFIFITDKESVPIIKNVVKGQIGKYLTESVIQNPDIRYKNAKDDNNFPKVKVEFIDIDIIITKHKTEIENMKKYFGFHFPPGTVFTPINGSGPTLVPVRKYQLDLFYIAPFYHLELPTELKKIIVIDIDLEFR